MQVIPQLWNAVAVWNEISPKLSTHLRDPLERVLDSADGAKLSREDCVRLANTSGDDLLALAAVADLLGGVCAPRSHHHRQALALRCRASDPARQRREADQRRRNVNGGAGDQSLAIGLRRPYNSDCWGDSASELCLRF